MDQPFNWVDILTPAQLRREEDLSNTLMTQVIVAPSRGRFRVTVSVSDGFHRSTARFIPGTFECQSIAWAEGMREASRLMDRMFQERDRDIVRQPAQTAG
jgi:hypothetical protein